MYFEFPPFPGIWLQWLQAILVSECVDLCDANSGFSLLMFYIYIYIYSGLTNTAIVAIAAGGAGLILIIVLLVLLLVCVYLCARRSTNSKSESGCP